MGNKITKKIITKVITTFLWDNYPDEGIDYNSEENQKVIRKVSKQKMDDFWTNLGYFKDDNEDKFDKMFNKFK